MIAIVITKEADRNNLFVNWSQIRARKKVRYWYAFTPLASLLPN